MIALFGVSAYRLDCIGGGLDWIGSCIFLLDCIGLGYFNSRSVKNWIGLHCVGNEKWITGSVVTGKVVKLDWIALAELRCISHWRCFE